jgi:hypothetical protein
MPLFLFLPKGYVISIRAKGRVNVNEVNAPIWDFLELYQTITAVNYIGLHYKLSFLISFPQVRSLRGLTPSFVLTLPLSPIYRGGLRG